MFTYVAGNTVGVCIFIYAIYVRKKELIVIVEDVCVQLKS